MSSYFIKFPHLFERINNSSLTDNETDQIKTIQYIIELGIIKVFSIKAHHFSPSPICSFSFDDYKFGITSKVMQQYFKKDLREDVIFTCLDDHFTQEYYMKNMKINNIFYIESNKEVNMVTIQCSYDAFYCKHIWDTKDYLNELKGKDSKI